MASIPNLNIPLMVAERVPTELKNEVEKSLKMIGD